MRFINWKNLTKIELRKVEWVRSNVIVSPNYNNGMDSLSQWWLAFTPVRGPSQRLLLLFNNFWEWRE